MYLYIMTDNQLKALIYSDITFAILAATDHLDIHWFAVVGRVERDDAELKNHLDNLRIGYAGFNGNVPEFIEHHKDAIERLRLGGDPFNTDEPKVTVVRIDPNTTEGKRLMDQLGGLELGGAESDVDGIVDTIKRIGLSCDTPLFLRDPFIGCDGKPNTDENLRAIMERMVDDEDYEKAAKYRDELARREKERTE